MNYIQSIRKKVGKDKIILNFTCGILSQSGKILLQKRADKGTWGLPGGAIELGESSVEALVREFYEETGITVKVHKLLNVYTKYSDSYPNGDEAQVITMLYLVKPENTVSNKSFVSDETLDLEFFDVSDIKNIAIVNQQHRDMILDFFENNFPIDR
mgnify:FL=1